MLNELKKIIEKSKISSKDKNLITDYIVNLNLKQQSILLVSFITFPELLQYFCKSLKSKAVALETKDYNSLLNTLEKELTNLERVENSI